VSYSLRIRSNTAIFIHWETQFDDSTTRMTPLQRLNKLIHHIFNSITTFEFFQTPWHRVAWIFGHGFKDRCVWICPRTDPCICSRICNVEPPWSCDPVIMVSFNILTSLVAFTNNLNFGFLLFIGIIFSYYLMIWCLIPIVKNIQKMQKGTWDYNKNFIKKKLIKENTWFLTYINIVLSIR